MRTFCTVIKDNQADKQLAPYGDLFGNAQRWAFKQIHVLDRSIGKVKAEGVKKFGFTSRQFNGVIADLRQIVETEKGTQKYTISRLENAIEATAEHIKMLDKQMIKAKTEKRYDFIKFKCVGKKQRLDALRNELKQAKDDLDEGRLRICFGGRKLLREEKICEWSAKRGSRIYLLGAKNDGVHANQSCIWDGESLRMRLPDSLGGKHIVLQGVKFRYGQDELLKILERNKNLETRIPLTWLLFRNDDGQWEVRVSFESPGPAITTDIKNGCVAVDLNVDHLAVVIIDNHGNPLSRLTLPFPEAGTDSNVATDSICNSVKVLYLLAKSRGYDIACENLDFSKKKAGLREYGPKHARRLSGFAYTKFFKALQARCNRDGVGLKQVNPAYTSVIGRTKYVRGLAMSVHHSAALVIGRRAQGHGERFVTNDAILLAGPVRNLPRAVGKRWRGVRRLAREGLDKRPVRTVRSGVRKAKVGVPRIEGATSRAMGSCPAGRITMDVSFTQPGSPVPGRRRDGSQELLRL